MKIAKLKISTRSKKQNKVVSSFKPRKIRIRVVGIGGGGSSIVAEMAQRLKGPSFVVSDTDHRVFKKVKGRRKIKVLQIGEKLLHGMGTGMDPEIAEKAAQEDREKISKIFEAQDLSVLVGSLGGGVASGVANVFAEEARKQRNITLGIFTLPFQFEGDKKLKLAQKALSQIGENLSGIVVVPNERIFQIVDRKTPLKKSLSQLNQMFANFVADLLEIISKPSLINIDFADLRTILKGRGEKLFFGQAMAQGSSRGEEVVKKIFQNPLLEEKPHNIKRILFNIAGGSDLGIKEVEIIGQSIAQVNSKAKIIFGISQTAKYNGLIKVSLLALSPSQGISRVVRNKSVKIKQAVFTAANNKKNNSNNGNNNKRKKKAVKKTTKKLTQKNNSKNIKQDKLETKKRRRSALEIKQTEKEQEEKDWLEASEWETPAFLKNNFD